MKAYITALTRTILILTVSCAFIGCADENHRIQRYVSSQDRRLYGGVCQQRAEPYPDQPAGQSLHHGQGMVGRNRFDQSYGDEPG